MQDERDRYGSGKLSDQTEVELCIPGCHCMRASDCNGQRIDSGFEDKVSSLAWVGAHPRGMGAVLATNFA